MKAIREYSVQTQVWALRHYGEAGPRTFRTLMAKFNKLEAVLEAELEEIISIEGLGEKRSQKIYNCHQALDDAEKFIESLKGYETNVVTSLDKNYPHLFNELNDPPPIIFYRGSLPEKDEKRVAIIGSHKATNEGISYTVELAGWMAKNSVSVVSGLARGIDTSAHIGALRADGKTYGILGSGFANIYPEEHKSLAVEMISQGGLISEYSPETPYSTGGNMARNRLIVGLSQAVVIGELFGDSTGTLDSAEFCHQTGKLMFVLIDGYENPDHDNTGVEKVISLGAIPISLRESVELIVNSLV